jgi:hypothetical protein
MTPSLHSTTGYESTAIYGRTEPPDLTTVGPLHAANRNILISRNRYKMPVSNARPSCRRVVYHSTTPDGMRVEKVAVGPANYVSASRSVQYACFEGSIASLWCKVNDFVYVYTRYHGLLFRNVRSSVVWSYYIILMLWCKIESGMHHEGDSGKVPVVAPDRVLW